jgi:flavodoxin
MKTLIVYDSVWGNTEKIAHAMGEAIRCDVKVVKAAEADIAGLSSYDLVLVGSPTQGGRPLASIREFLAKIPAGGLSNVRVAAFDTRTDLKGCLLFFLGTFLGFAAPRLTKTLQGKGGNLVAAPEGFRVVGKEGPITAGELERAATWARRITE